MARGDVSIEGVLVVDKPSGITSHDLVERVRKLMSLRRVGHTGTLDPFASGVMVLCLGRATRVARYFEGLDKAYRTLVKLGVVTDTGDGEGTVLETHHVRELSAQRVESALGLFRGRITQQVPAFSAVKVAGQRLYARARRGEKVSGPLKEVDVETLRMESFEADELGLFVECSKGTYIRSLAQDIGRRLGCGAHCKSLVRTRVGPFALEEASALQELERLGAEAVAERLLGLDQALGRFLGSVGLSPKGARLLSNGSPVEEDGVARAPEVLRPETPYRALDPEGRLIALVEAEKLPGGTRWVPTRVLATAN